MSRSAAASHLLVIAHRGASAYAPEHTFAAWDHALEIGADYLEQDLRMSRDGALVVLHDETLNRTARDPRRGRAPVHARADEHDLATLRLFDTGSWFNEAYPDRARATFVDQRIATLDEVFGRYRDRAGFYVETRPTGDARGMEAALLALLDRHGLREPAIREWRVLVQSFSERSLRVLHALEPRLPLVRLLTEREARSRRLPEDLASIASYGVGIGPPWAAVDERLVAEAGRHCLAVHPWTVNDPAVMARLAGMGVGGLFTDAPDVLLAQRPADEPRGGVARLAAAGHNERCRGERGQQRGG